MAPSPHPGFQWAQPVKAASQWAQPVKPAPTGQQPKRAEQPKRAHSQAVTGTAQCSAQTGRQPQRARSQPRQPQSKQQRQQPLALQGSLLHARGLGPRRETTRRLAPLLPLKATRPGKKAAPAPSRAPREEPLALVSEAQHVEVHAGFQGFCIRCDVQRRRNVYEAISMHNGASWLAGRSNRGRWSLGCTQCANFYATGKKCGDARFSRFSKFLVRPTSTGQAKFLIEQHHRARSHRIACGITRVPLRARRDSVVPCAQSDSPSSSIGKLWPAAEQSAEDDALLKGNVPSPEDWQDAWAHLSERMSLRQAARLFHKAFKKKQRGDPEPLAGHSRRRKRYRRQLCAMAELTRRRIREALRRATSITLALDESKYRKVIRFRADLPSRVKGLSGSFGRHVNASGFCVSGVLGLLDCSKKHAEDFEEDHAVTAVKQFDAFFTRFCTPLGRVRGHRAPEPLACDQELKKLIQEKVFCISADGAPKERRAVFLVAREFFPNLLIVIRDSAHAIRIAIKALHCDDVFGQVWHQLFDAKHALVPDLMHSDKWHNLLVAIQEDNARVLARPGDPEPLAGVLRNVAFAKQRFDSTADPVAKVALMSLPLATLLAHVASDRRHDKAQRERALALLKKLDTKFCIATGVSADWGIICIWFLRLFDEAYHDIAKSRSEIDCMLQTLDAVFVQGRVFQDLVAAPGAVAQGTGAMAEPLPQLPAADGRGEVGFITGKVLRNLRKKYVFYAGGTPVLLWGEPQETVKRDLLERLRNVASLTKQRLQADFPRDDIRSALAIFDRRLVHKGFGPQPVLEVRQFMLRGVAHLATLHGVEQVAATLQYNQVLPYMIAQSGPSQPLAGLSNQQAWALLLDDDVWQEACPKRYRSASGALRVLIRFYISIEDGECTVERDLGEFREAKVVSKKADMRFLDDMLMLKLNGPKTLAEFRAGQADSLSQLTPFSRDCASLWRQLFGACGGHYNAEATMAAQEKATQKAGFRKTVHGVLAAARLALVSSRRVAARGADAASGAAQASPAAGTPQSAFWNASMTEFHKHTTNNIPGAAETRSRPGAPFILPPGVHLTRRAGAVAQPLARSRPYAKVAFLSNTPAEQPRMCTTFTGTHRCAEADLVVVPHLSMLHDVDVLAGSLDLTICLLYIVALGLDITTQRHLDAAGGVPRDVQPLACVRHVPAKETKLTFRVGAALAIEQPDVHRALRRIARSPRSKFTVSAECAAVPDAVCFSDLRAVVTWACSVRRTRTELGPKTCTVDGVAMPT